MNSIKDMKPMPPSQKPTQTSDTMAWRGAWDRPLKLDEKSLDPFTVARMTDHNVRGMDEEKDEEISSIPANKNMKQSAA
jgi:hypothetical protein